MMDPNFLQGPCWVDQSEEITDEVVERVHAAIQARDRAAMGEVWFMLNPSGDMQAYLDHINGIGTHTDPHITTYDNGDTVICMVCDEPGRIVAPGFPPICEPCENGQ